MPEPTATPARRLPVLLAAAVLAVALGLGLAALVGRPSPAGAPGTTSGGTVAASPGAAPSAVAPPPATAPTGPPGDAAARVDAPRIAFLGDSLTVGLGAPPGRGYAWQTAELLGWPVALVDGVSGSGFLAPGGGEPMPARVPAVVAARPDVVVVAGGTNDVAGRYPPQDVRRAAERLLEDLRRGLPDARVVVLGPLPTSFDAVDDPDPTGDAVRAAAEAAGAEHLDAGEIVGAAVADEAAWDGYISSDGLHPNERGYRRLAEALADALDALVP